MSPVSAPGIASGASVALLVPSHNRCDLIAATLRSVLDQAVSPEHLAAAYLADDGSTDGTIQAAVSAWNCGVPLEVLDRRGAVGQFENVNQALDRIVPKHDWVLVLHDDDLAMPTWLGTLLTRISSCESKVASICSSWDVIHADGRIEQGENDVDRDVELVTGEPEAVRGTLLRGCWWHFSGCAIRTAAFRDVGAFDVSLPQSADWDWLLRCLEAGWKLEYVPRSLIGYRQHTGSVSSLSFRAHRDLLERFTIAEKHGRFLRFTDISPLYLPIFKALLRRTAGAGLRGRWMTAGTAVKLIPALAASAMRTRRIAAM